MNTMNNDKNRNILIENCLISLANNKVDAMDLLYKTIKNNIYAYAISKSIPNFDIDDLVQDTFVRIYENAKLYEPLGKPMAWIITIETNVINRYYQTRKREEEKSKEYLLNNEIVSFSTSYNENEFLKLLLNNLKEEEKEIISLHIVSNLKFKEIAKIMDKPLSTILSKYNRSIKKLKNLVKDKNYEK